MTATCNTYKIDLARLSFADLVLDARESTDLPDDTTFREGQEMVPMKWKHMRRIIIVFACAMMAPLTFGQAEHSGQIQHQTDTGAVIVGTVTAFKPGLRNVEPRPPIVVQSSADTEPVSYMLARKVLFEDKNGRAFSPRLVRPGTRVKLGFDRRGKVNRVIVVQDNKPDLRGRPR